MLTSSTGAKIPLSQVADVRLSVGESTITREMNRRHLTVKLNLRGRDLTSFLNEAQNTINEKVHYDKIKYTIKWGGAFENQKRAYTRLAVIIPADTDGDVYTALCHVREVPAGRTGIGYCSSGTFRRYACS